MSLHRAETLKPPEEKNMSWPLPSPPNLTQHLACCKYLINSYSTQVVILLFNKHFVDYLLWGFKDREAKWPQFPPSGVYVVTQGYEHHQVQSSTVSALTEEWTHRWGCVTNHSGFTQKAQSPLTLWFHCLIFPIHPTSLLLFLKVFPKPTAMPEQTPKHSSFELCSSWVIPFHSQPWDSLIRLHSSTMTVFMGRERRAFSAN